MFHVNEHTLCLRTRLASINAFYTGSTIHGVELHVRLETTENNSRIVICVRSNFNDKTRGIAGNDDDPGLLIGTTVIVIVKSHNIKCTAVGAFRVLSDGH